MRWLTGWLGIFAEGQGNSFKGAALLYLGLTHEALQPRPHIAGSLIGAEAQLLNPWTHDDHLLSGRHRTACTAVLSQEEISCC